MRTILPFTITGFAVFMLMIPSIKLLAMDDAVATGLGGRVAVVRAICMLLVILLAGSAVAICGPIGFIGLVVPHIARALVGGKLVLLVPLTALLGGSLGRVLIIPREVSAGIMTAIIGAPYFLYLLHRARRRGG